MFEDEPSSRQQQSMVQDHFRYILQSFQIVGWISKDNMVLLFTNRNEPENIHAYRMDALHMKLFSNSGNEVHRTAVVINQIDFAASPRSKLKANAACSTKQVENPNIFKCEMIGHDIEQRLTGKIGSGP